MAIFYNKVERGNPADPAAPKKWYPVLKSLGMVREKEEVTAANVTKINIRFKPGKELTEALSKAQLRPVEGLTWFTSGWFLSVFCKKLPPKKRYALRNHLRNIEARPPLIEFYNKKR